MGLVCESTKNTSTVIGPDRLHRCDVRACLPHGASRVVRKPRAGVSELGVRCVGKLAVPWSRVPSPASTPTRIPNRSVAYAEDSFDESEDAVGSTAARAPLYLTARNGTNVTLEAMNNGHRAQLGDLGSLCTHSPGARQGFHRVQSSSEPAGTARFSVRYLGSLIVAFIPLLHLSIPLGLAPPTEPPSGTLHPIVVPTVMYRHVCAEAHGSDPFRHAHAARPFSSDDGPAHLSGDFLRRGPGTGQGYQPGDQRRGKGGQWGRIITRCSTLAARCRWRSWASAGSSCCARRPARIGTRPSSTTAPSSRSCLPGCACHTRIASPKTRGIPS